MFLNRYCHKEAVRYYVQETIKDEKLTVEEKTYIVLNAKKIIKKKAKEMRKRLLC